MTRGPRMLALMLALMLVGAACGGGETTENETAAGNGDAADDGAAVEADESFPERPLQITVGWSAGGSSDLTSRALAREMEEYFGQSVQIANVEGATGGVGASEVTRANHDGYTLFGGASVHGMWPVMEQADVGWTDFYALLAGPHLTAIYVPEDSPFETLDDLVTGMEDDPTMRYGSPGPGSNGHLFGEMVLEAGGVKAEHVPYGGGSEAGQFLGAGEVAWAAVTLGDITDMAESGQVRPLVVLYDEPVEAAGFEIDPISDYYPELEDSMAINPWFGLYVHRDTPDEIVMRLADAVEYATEQERFIETFKEDLAGVIDFQVGQGSDEVMARVESGRAWELWELGMAERDPAELDIPTIADFSWPPHPRAEEAAPWPAGLES